MALTLPKASTIKIQATDTLTGTKDTIPMTTRVGQLMPILTIPSILALIRNTSVRPAQSMNENSRYMAQVKATSRKSVSKANGKAGRFTQDPRTASTTQTEAMLAQITPESDFGKYGDINWDTLALRDSLLAGYVGSFIATQRTDKSFRAIDEMIVSADTEQAKIKRENAQYTTFKKGAHVEVKNIATAEEAYDIYSQAIAGFQRIGSKRAVSNISKAYKHTNGISKPDMFVFLSAEFEALLLSKAGVFASDSGIKLFKDAGIKSILGVQTVSTIALPQGVNFLIVTTGLNGTYGYEEVGGGIKAILDKDPDFFHAKRLDLEDIYTMGSVLPFQMFYQKNA